LISSNINERIDTLKKIYAYSKLIDSDQLFKDEFSAIWYIV